MKKFAYITCPVTKSKKKLSMMSKVSKVLEEFEYIVFEPDTALTAKRLFQRDVRCLGKSSLIIGDFTYPSHGVGFEAGLAFVKNIPLIALVEKGAKISRIIKGNTKINIVEYSSEREAVEKIRRFLGNKLKNKLKHSPV